MKLYRVMRIDPTDGGPLVGVRRNMLGVRPTDPTNTIPGRKFDVPAVLPTDTVEAGLRHGLSLSATDTTLDAGKNEAVWEIDGSDFPAALVAVPAGPPHYILGPRNTVTLAQFQGLLASTRPLWRRVT